MDPASGLENTVQFTFDAGKVLALRKIEAAILRVAIIDVDSQGKQQEGKF